MGWLIPLFITVFFWGIYDVLSAKLPGLFTPFFTYAVIPLIQFVLFALAFLIFEKNHAKISTDNLWLLIVLAVVLSIGNVAFYISYKSGAPISVAVPISTIGVAILGVIWGVFIAKEPVTVKLSVGLILSIVGIVLMSS